jgi:hypothetical protein
MILWWLLQLACGNTLHDAVTEWCHTCSATGRGELSAQRTVAFLQGLAGESMQLMNEKCLHPS